MKHKLIRVVAFVFAVLMAVPVLIACSKKEYTGPSDSNAVTVDCTGGEDEKNDQPPEQDKEKETEKEPEITDSDFQTCQSNQLIEIPNDPSGLFQESGAGDTIDFSELLKQ